MEKRYCAAPWRGLHINPRGDVKTCCAGDPNMLGNLNENSITEILTGSGLIEIRDSLTQGKMHPQYCHNCIEAERYGTSERAWHNSVNPDFDPKSPGTYSPSIIDVRWNTTCNLSCNYCGPKCSSRWASLMKEYHDSNTRHYFEDVCEFIDRHKDSVREVALVGGEPLLLPENRKLLSIIPQDAIITLITNMSVPFQNNDIVMQLSKRTRVGWSMSFDNVNERFEYVRYGGVWSLLDHNVRTVKELSNTMGHWGGIHAVYNIYNCTRLCELREYADRVGFVIHWQTLFQPDFLDPAMHSDRIRYLAQQEILQYQQQFEQTEHDRQFLGKVLSSLGSQPHDLPDMGKSFEEHVYLMENKYHHGMPHFAKLWPEIAEIL